MVYFHVGRSEPGWGKEACWPVWWPEEVEFIDVNKSNKGPHLDDLISIMHSYRNWNQQQHPQEVDITVNGWAHSPVIPIPVSSIPASAFISDPPSSAPEVFASPICPPAPSSTPAQSPFLYLILPLQLLKVTFNLLLYLRTLLRGNWEWISLLW